MNFDNVELKMDKHTLKVKIKGDIDHHNARSIREKIDTWIFSKKPSLILLDLSLVEFMDSSGLGLIMGRYNSATEIGASFVIYKPNYRVKKILSLAGVERIITIKGDDVYAQ